MGATSKRGIPQKGGGGEVPDHNLFKYTLFYFFSIQKPSKLVKTIKPFSSCLRVEKNRLSNNQLYGQTDFLRDYWRNFSFGADQIFFHIKDGNGQTKLSAQQ